MQKNSSPWHNKKAVGQLKMQQKLGTIKFVWHTSQVTKLPCSEFFIMIIQSIP